jgi:hypothetical protein
MPASINQTLRLWDLGSGNAAVEARRFEEGGRRDLNPQQPEPQSGALPLSYDHHVHGEKERSASSGSAKHIFGGGRAPGARRFRRASVHSEFIATHVPINYRSRLIFHREQISESPSLAGLVETRCGRAI